MIFPHPISSNVNFEGGQDSRRSNFDYITYQFEIRLIRATEGKKILLHLDPTSGIGPGTSLFVCFNKYHVELPLEPNMRIKPPALMSETLITTFLISISTNKDLKFSCQAFALESNPYKY